MFDNFLRILPDGAGSCLDLGLLRNLLIRLAREEICIRDFYTIIECFESGCDYEAIKGALTAGFN